MDPSRLEAECRTRWLVLVFVLASCLGSVRSFGQNQDSEFTFLLPAGASECFFQTAIRNGTMEVEYQVISGAGMDVNFYIRSPQDRQLVAALHRSDGVHMVDTVEEGDYQICFDNSFSLFSEKMVFFEVIIEGQGGDVGGDYEWAGLLEPEGSLLEYKLEDIRVVDEASLDNNSQQSQSDQQEQQPLASACPPQILPAGQRSVAGLAVHHKHLGVDPGNPLCHPTWSHSPLGVRGQVRVPYLLLKEIHSDSDDLQKFLRSSVSRPAAQ